MFSIKSIFNKRKSMKFFDKVAKLHQKSFLKVYNDELKYFLNSFPC